MSSEAEVKSNVQNLELFSDNYPFRLSLRIRNFENETAYKKFVRNCEGLIRKCGEYKLWRNYIVDVLQVNTCMITHESIDQVSIDVHHHIPSMFTLVSALVNKKIENNEDYLTIPVSFVKGDYQHFLDEYSRYIDEQDLDTIQSRLAVNESNCTWARDEYPVAAEG